MDVIVQLECTAEHVTDAQGLLTLLFTRKKTSLQAVAVLDIQQWSETQFHITVCGTDSSEIIHDMKQG